MSKGSGSSVLQPQLHAAMATVLDSRATMGLVAVALVCCRCPQQMMSRWESLLEMIEMRAAVAEAAVALVTAAVRPQQLLPPTSAYALTVSVSMPIVRPKTSDAVGVATAGHHSCHSHGCNQHH
mmetsp:Transcript_58910/g.113622  ORF Transcript_58910/g.113622 Transcript_58910/m.113622 type:complete len:124 (-) Transcript_58910:88-459(-)